MASWTPQQTGLQEILQTVHDSTDTNISVQRSITQVRSADCGLLTQMLTRRPIQKLNSFTRVPDYVAYLAYILAHMPDQPDRIRSIAAYLLKNNARAIHLSTSPEAVHFVKASILRAFTDQSSQVRSAASQDIVAYLAVLEPRNWPECLQLLVSSLDSEDGGLQEVRSSVHCQKRPRF